MRGTILARCVSRGRKLLCYIVIVLFVPSVSPCRGICKEPSVVVLPSLSGQWVTAVAAGEGGIWAGTAGGQVTFLPGGVRTGRTYGPAVLPPGKVNSLAVAGGKVYAGSEGGLSVLDGSSWKIIPSAEKITLKNVYLRAEPGGGALWACAVELSGGLLRLSEGSWHFLGGAGAGLMNHFQAFAFMGETAWLGSISSGVLSRKGGEVRTFRAKDGLPSETVYALEASEGTVWAGTSAGPARFADGRWAPFPKGPAQPLSAVFCMAAGTDALYLGGPEGLVRYREGRFDPFPAADSIPRVGRVNALLFHEGALYVGASDGLLRIEGW